MKMKRKGKKKKKWIFMIRGMLWAYSNETQWKSVSASLAIEGRFLEGSVFKKKLFHSCGECAQINSKMMDPRWLSPTQAQAPILLSDVKTRT